MDALKIVACPFCGVMPNNHHGSLRMVHKDYCFFSKAKNLCSKYMSLGWEDTIQAWNDRAGGRKPTVPKTVGVKAVGSSAVNCRLLETANRLIEDGRFDYLPTTNCPAGEEGEGVKIWNDLVVAIETAEEEQRQNAKFTHPAGGSGGAERK